VVDYWLMRAVMLYYAQPTPPLPNAAGLTTNAVEAIADMQERYNLVIAHYLAEAISLGRAAELLGLTWLDLRMRAVKLAIPQRHLTEEDVTADLNNTLTWAVDE
jgi:predicted HTH domain antitoxin